MVHLCDLPLVVPARLARPLTEREVMLLAGGRPVPGVDPDDPRVQAIMRCSIPGGRWQDIEDAHRRGCLQLIDGPDPDVDRRVKELWGWRCAAARVPEIVTHLAPRTLDTTLHADLSPAGLVFSPHALMPLARAIAEYAGTDLGGWWFTRDTLDLDGLPADAAWALAAALVTMMKDRRYVETE